MWLKRFARLAKSQSSPSSSPRNFQFSMPPADGSVTYSRNPPLSGALADNLICRTGSKQYHKVIYMPLAACGPVRRGRIGGVPVMIYGRNGFLMTTTTTAACTNCSGAGRGRRRERERQREREVREREQESKCVCVLERERERVELCVSASV